MKKASILPISENPLIQNRNLKRKVSVTVCIAAICENGVIIGAADRMLSSGDIQFEPTANTYPSKVIPLTRSIVAMTAGDAGLQTEILHEVHQVVNARVMSQPDNWWNVKDAVDVYVNFYNFFKLKRARERVLAPLGLDEKTFVSKQQTMSKEFVTQITQEMINFEMPPVATIITGVDNFGAHIYAIHDNQILCCDAIGFASIGIGARHAESQFMLRGHTRLTPMPETALLTYSAKKKSEVAPGVGKGTDMFAIGPNLGSFGMIFPDGILAQAEFDSIQDEVNKKIDDVIITANQRIDKYVRKAFEEAAKKMSAKQAAPKAAGESAPADGAAISNNPEKK
jgi:hypothetical protein